MAIVVLKCNYIIDYITEIKYSKIKVICMVIKGAPTKNA